MLHVDLHTSDYRGSHSENIAIPLKVTPETTLAELETILEKYEPRRGDRIELRIEQEPELLNP